MPAEAAEMASTAWAVVAAVAAWTRHASVSVTATPAAALKMRPLAEADAGAVKEAAADSSAEAASPSGPALLAAALEIRPLCEAAAGVAKQ
mmetsp:Transcript_72472/g.186938  ORF Transcript_72472/g.186938 Transcript_72472/m.186938 type:complete len:91 (-) Transcript_72472:199-471(-)